jgi:multidrug efflux system outer membrane protein
VKTNVFIILATSLTVSCSALRPAPQEADLAQLIPDTFSGNTSTALHGQRWWTDFGNAELCALVEKALSCNLTVVQADARLRQSRALARQAAAGGGPTLTGNASAARSRSRAETGTEGTVTTDADQFELGLAASYELDLWGRVRSQASAARATVTATHFDLEAVAVTVAAETADAWLRLLEQRSLIQLLEAQRQTSRIALSTLEVRRQRGAASALDVYQQQQNVASIDGLIPTARAAASLLEHQLAILTGSPPGTDIAVKTSGLPGVPPVPGAGIPADVLAQRPDVAAALHRFEAAGWNTAAAQADRLPAIRLTAAASYRSDDSASLFDNWLSNLAANLALPLIDRGKRKAEAERARAVEAERLAVYKAVILDAIRDVEDALVSERGQRERLEHLENELNLARKAMEEADRRYRRGLNDYLRVLTALTSVQGIERRALSARREYLSNRIGLYRALGGRWMAETVKKE